MNYSRKLSEFPSVVSVRLEALLLLVLCLMVHMDILKHFILGGTSPAPDLEEKKKKVQVFSLQEENRCVLFVRGNFAK